MAPTADYSPLLPVDRSDRAVEHAFPPPEHPIERDQRRLPSKRPPLWIPDPFSFRSGSTADRDGAARDSDSDSDSDSGEDTVYGSDVGEDSSEEKRPAGSGPAKDNEFTDEEDGWEFSLAALQKDRTRVCMPEYSLFKLQAWETDTRRRPSVVTAPPSPARPLPGFPGPHPLLRPRARQSLRTLVGTQPLLWCFGQQETNVARRGV